MNEPPSSMTPGIHESRERYALFVPPRSAVPVARERRAPGPADPKAPWTSDHPWRPAGMLPDYSRDTRGSMLRRIALVVLIALFNIALPAAPFALKLVLLVLDLVALLILIDLILKIAHELHHPRTRMRWTTFPAFLGGRLEGTLLVRPAQYVFSALQVRLRCVQDERNERHPEDAGLEPHVIYEQSFEAVPPGETLTELPLSFQLPEDLPGTHLDRAEATYWQVAVRIPVTGPDIEAVFLAPVYERDHP